MARWLFCSVVRIVALCLVAAAVYVAVYVPMMNMFFQKGPEGLLIIGLLIMAAFKCAKFADRRLPRAASPDFGREAGG